MAKEIDEKVVSMKFDNKQFMDKTSETMTQVDKLKNSLQFSDASKGLNDINRAAGNTDLSPLGNAVEQVRVKFDVLQIFAKRILENIADTAYYTGKRIVSALTIDPVKMGLQEYETQINAVQTIMANTESKGTTLDDVNAALDELNKYADKTIYNFTEMTRNIGTFTAAGVELDTSVNAIQGIANLAAVSGSSSQQASTAMYQLSQALSSGTVKLMDWNSVVNAGMGGQVFQDALKETARVHDIAIDDMIEEQGSFRETLSEGWLTSEILLETLEKFTMATEGATEAEIEANRAKLKSIGYTDEQIEGIFKLGNTAQGAATDVKTFSQLMDTLKEAAQSGWTQTWEIIIGDFEEAKKLWSSVYKVFSDIINASAEARNIMLQGWSDGGGREALKQTFVNVWEALLAVIRPIKEAFRDIFPRTTAQQLIKITEAIRDFTSKLILSEKVQRNLKSAFRGFFAVLDIGWTIIKAIAKGIWELAGYIINVFSGMSGGIFDAVGALGEWLVGIRDTAKKSNIFGTVIGGIVTALKKVVDVIALIITKIKESKIFNAIIDALATAFGKLVDVIALIVTKIKESKIFTTIINGISFALQKMVEVIKIVFNFLKEKIRFPSLEGFLNVLKAIWNGIKWVFSKIFQGLGVVGKAFLDAFRAGDFQRALDIFKSGIVAGILLNIKGFTSGFKDLGKGVKDIIGGITGILDGARDCLKAFASEIKARALLTIAKAVAILTVALLVLSFIPADKLDEALSVITVLFMELLGVMTAFNAITKGGGATFRVSISVINMAIALTFLASALKKIAGLGIDQVTSGLIGIAGLSIIISLVAKTMAKNNGVLLKGATGLISFAIALRILVSVCKSMAKMSWGEMIQGLVGVAGLTAAVTVVAVAMSKNNGKIMKGATGMISFALGMKILVSVCKSMAEMKLGSMLQGLGGLAGLLLALVGAMRLMPKNMVKMGMQLVTMALALRLLVPVITTLGSMSLASVGTALLAMAGALTILGFALKLMSGTLKGVGALMVAAIALNMLAIPLRILGTMNITAVGIALLALAGTLGVFVVAGYLLMPVIGIIFKFGVAVALVGAGLLACGLAVTLFATALLTLIGIAATGAAAIVAAFGALLTGIIGFGALIAQAIGTLITGICSAIVMSIDAICNAIAAIIIAICNAITKALPAIMNCLGVILDELCEFILKYVPKLVDVACQLIIALLTGLSMHIDKIVEAAVKLIAAFIAGIGSQIGPLLDAACKLVIDLINGIADAIDKYMPLLMDACVNLGKSICEGIGYGIGAGVGSIWTMIKSVGQGIIDGFKNTLGINSPAKVMIPIGQGLDEGVVVGMERYKGLITDASEDVGKTAVDSMANAISGISDVVNSDIDSQPVIRPVLDLTEVASGANTINGMFRMTPSVGVMSNVGAINSMMSGNQNGGNFDIVSAIKDLGRMISEMPRNVTTINGVTYDDGSNVVNAVETLVRAAKMERRV